MKNKIVFIMALVLAMASSPVLNARPSKKKATTKKAEKEKVSKGLEAKDQGLDKNKKKNDAKSKADKEKYIAQKKKEEANQLKAEIKEWHQRKRAMEPLQLKDVIEENHRLKTQQRDLNTYIQELELRLKVQQQKTEQLIKQHAEKEKLYIAGTGATPRELEDLTPGSYTVDVEKGQVFIDGVLDNRYGVDKETGKPFIKGIIFKVQVSADKDIDLSDVLVDDSHHTNLEYEKKDDLNKYTIGHFRNYWEADKLKKGLRKMGVRWAWIVPYKDGKRVLLKEVLDTVVKSKKE
jgi:hypothetical protein